MTGLLDVPTVLSFRPQRAQGFLDDESRGEIVLYFGQVQCPGCGRGVDVSAPDGGLERGYCHRCGAEIQVIAMETAHLRMDDSRSRWNGHGCICGSPLCRTWEPA